MRAMLLRSKRVPGGASVPVRERMWMRSATRRVSPRLSSRLIDTDREACGQECVVCFEGGSCCDGDCVALSGCAPGSGSSSLCNNAPCGSCENICTGNNTFCCNQGHGTPGACVDAVNGLCPSPPF